MARFGVRDNQRQTFIFGALGHFKLGVLLESLRRLMSNKLALHVLAKQNGFRHFVPHILRNSNQFSTP